jgi:hypothetical protein
VLAAAIPSVAMADKWDEVKKPDKTTPIADWTPVQQWKFAQDLFNTNRVSALMYADMMGDKLSELGRAWMLEKCINGGREANAEATAVWAVCGADAKALDLKKAEAEVKAEAAGDREGERVLEQIKNIKENGAKIGAAVEAAAKDDPGLQKVLKLADDAKAEWSAWVDKNGDLYARARAMVDGVHSNKTTHNSFEGCWDKTYPAFSKLVKATKFPWDPGNDYLPSYWFEMLGTIDGYMTATAFAECAYSVHESGEALVASSFNRPAGVLKWGARTVTLTKIADASFKPKFGDRSLSWPNMVSRVRDNYHAKFEGINDTAQIMTPAEGAVGKVKVDGDVAKIDFKGDKVEACLQWVETKKVQSVSPNGDVQYEKQCKKRGMVENQTGSVEVSSKFTAGLKPGVQVAVIYKVPVVVWTGKKFVALFGVAGDIKQK